MRRLFCLPLAVLSASAFGQLIVGNDQSGTATIYNINVGTGVATPLISGSTAAYKPWGMAADNANSRLYWNNGSSLYSATYADLIGGNPTLTPIGMTFNAAIVNFVGLGFRNGKLYGTRNIATEAVYEIDPITGVATQVWVHPTTFDFGGLDFDDATGKLYGLSDTAPAGGVRGLYEIDYIGGTTTFVAGYPGTETDIDGLAVGGGKAYFVTDGPNTTQASMYVYNLSTNAFENPLPSPFTGSGTFSAGAWAPGLVPEPGTMLALGAGMAALATRRRRKSSR